METIKEVYDKYTNSDCYNSLRTSKDIYDITTYGTEPFKEQKDCDSIKDALKEKGINIENINIENINENGLEIIGTVLQKQVRHYEESKKTQDYGQTIIDYCKNTGGEKQKIDAGETFIFRPFGLDSRKPYYNHTVCLTPTNEGDIELRDSLSYKKHPEVPSEIKQRIRDTFVCNNITETDFVESSKPEISGKQKSAQGCFEVCLVAAMLKNNNVEKDTYNNVMRYLVEIIQLSTKDSLGTKQESIRIEAYEFIEKIRQTLSSKGSLEELLLLEKLKKATGEEALSTEKGNSRETGC